MFNCRNNLTFKPFCPFSLKLGLGGPSDGIARNLLQGVNHRSKISEDWSKQTSNS